MTSNAVRLGVDIGGTFTDVVLEKDGASFSTKVLTTYAAPEDAIIEGLHQVCEKASVSPGEIAVTTKLASSEIVRVSRPVPKISPPAALESSSTIVSGPSKNASSRLASVRGKRAPLADVEGKVAVVVGKGS